MKAMIKITKLVKRFVLLPGLALAALLGCEPDDTDALPTGKPNTAEVFIDGFSPGLDYQAFGDSKVSAFEVDDLVTFSKSDASMRFDVPSNGDPEGGYAGGIFFDEGGRDFSDYNVLTFWGRASQAATIQELGFGLYTEETFRTAIRDVPFSTAWTKYYIILPDASRLTDEPGAFYFVDTPDLLGGYSFWIDDLKYEKLGTIGQIRPIVFDGEDADRRAFVGQVIEPSGLGLVFSLPNGADQQVDAAPAYFQLASSTGNATIRVDETTGLEEVVINSPGEAVITASLGEIEAQGSVTLDISEYDPAPVPQRPAGNVISIFSDAYENVPVDFYNGFYAPFQSTQSADFEVNGDNVLNYFNYNFVGIEFNQNVPPIDGSQMDFLHLDIYIPESFDPGSTLRINLRDFGPDGGFAGGDDTTISTLLSESTTPALVSGQWISVDFDISSMANRNRLGQILLDAETNDGPRPSAFFVDNIYLYNEGPGGGGPDPIPPSAPATAPTQPEANVISIYSDSYTDVPKDGFNFYGAAAFEEVDIAGSGNNALRYTFVDGGGGNFQVIELGGANQIDAAAAGMTNFRFDLYFPNEVTASTNFLLKLVDIGAATSEAQLFVDASSTPPIEQGTWLSFDFTLAELATAGLAGTSNIQQVVIDLLNSGEVYVDNIYFYEDTGGGGGPIPPSAPAADPTQAEGDVISVYSDSYTDVPKDGFNFYGAAAFEEVDIAGSGNSALRYTFVDTGGGNFQVIELGGANQIDAAAAGMTNFRFDLYFPNEVDGSTNFLMKLVDFGATTSEAQLFVDSSSMPPIAQGTWLSFDFTLAELATAGLAGTSNIQQIVIDLLSSGEVYVDNIYFYDSAGSGGGGAIPPSAPAADPTQAEVDVISVYSDSYTDVPKDGFNLYGAAAFEEVDIAGSGNSALKYTWVDTGGGNFQVIELGGANQIDAAAAGMTNFRFDLYFPNAVDGSTNFLMKLVDFGATTSEAQLFVDSSSMPPIAQGTWLSFDFTLAELATAGLAGTSNIQQIVIDLLSSGEVYVDNIYFYDSAGSGGGGAIPPSAPAADPTQAEADVISVYSDSYTDVPKDGFNLYGAAAFEEVDIAGSGNSALKYTWVDTGGGNFQVIELGGANQIDATAAGMTNFRFDLYFPNAVDGSTNFLMKLVDFGAATTEAQLFIDSASTPPISQGAWLSFDFTLAELGTAGIGGTSNIQQIVIDLLSSGEVYVDNIYFYK